MSQFRTGGSVVVGGGGTVAVGYAVGDRTLKVPTSTRTANFGDFGALVFANILEETPKHWAPNATINPVTSAYIMEFIFAEAVDLQAWHWELGSAGSWGTWVLAVFRNGAYEDMDATITLGSAISTIITIDADKQSGVSQVRLTGSSGIVSGAPFVENIRFLAVEE